MENLGKYIKINLLIVLIYIVFINVLLNTIDEGRGILIYNMIPIALHELGLFYYILYALVLKEKKDALALLLTAIIVLIVGFSSCWGSAAITY